MPFDERTKIALEAIRPRIELFQSAVAATTEQIRGLLAGTGVSEEDQTVALGKFASGHVDVERFSAFTRQAAKIDQEAELPISTAQKVLGDLLEEGDKLFVLELAEGASLAVAVARRLAKIGRAFSAAKVVDLAKRGEYREEEHALLLDGLAYCDWSQAERALAPGLVVRLDGADFVPVQVAAYFDTGMKYVFEVEKNAPPAALSRLVTPGVFVQQQSGDAALEAFSSFEGAAAAALMPEGAVEFVHDPAAGETSFERFTTLEFPREIRKRAVGGISVSQQAEDYALLETMAVVPTPSGDAASDPAGKLSAWLLSQTDLVGAGKT